MNDPFISIITPSLNRVAYIAEAVESVLSQNYPGFEHIIVDGGSTDGTLALLRSHPHLRVISEPDQGIYHALNKGIRMAQGQIIGHLNSDDFYEDDVFCYVAEQFGKDPGLEAIRGGAVVFEEKSDGSRTIAAIYADDSHHGSYFRSMVLGVPLINTCFFRKKVYDKVGLYDTLLTIAADKDFLVRTAMAGVRCPRTKRVFYHYRQHPGSLTMSRHSVPWFKICDEQLEIAERYLRDDRTFPEAERIFRLWHSREASEGILHALREMRLPEVMQYGLRGWRYDKWWLPRFLIYVFRKIGNLVSL